jgi:uncharacterized membrane protein YfcA
MRVDLWSIRALDERVNAHLLLGVALIGLGVGFLSGAFGKGGSALATPLLHAIGVPAILAIASPLPATIPSTWIAGRAYARAGNVDRRILRLGLGIGLPATVVGAALTRWIPGGPLIVATDIVVLAFGIRILLTRNAPLAPDAERATTVRVLVVVGLVASVSSMLGNSGGLLLAPLFMSALGVPIHRAFGTSLVLATFLAIPGTIVHAYLGHIDWTITLAFGCAAMPAASAGAQIALRAQTRSLTLAYGLGISTLAGGMLAISH